MNACMHDNLVLNMPPCIHACPVAGLHNSEIGFCVREIDLCKSAVHPYLSEVSYNNSVMTADDSEMSPHKSEGFTMNSKIRFCDREVEKRDSETHYVDFEMIPGKSAMLIKKS